DQLMPRLSLSYLWLSVFMCVPSSRLCGFACASYTVSDLSRTVGPPGATQRVGEFGSATLTPLPRRPVFALVLPLAGPGLAHGPHVSLLRKVGLPAESLQSGNRLRAIDRLLTPIASPRTAAGFVGQLGLLLSSLEAPFALAPVVSEKPLDVWEQAEE